LNLFSLCAILIKKLNGEFMNNEYLKETNLLDFSHPLIKKLIEEKRWDKMNKEDALKSIYEYVQNEILFGYNLQDNLKASAVLKDGYGQCNTKSTLFMALLRGVKIPCYVRGFMIDKSLQYGAMKGLVYKKAPKEILHTYVVVIINNTEYELEGIILDNAYLKALQIKFKDHDPYFIGYGVATENLFNPKVSFNNCSTYIQSLGITKDLGKFTDMDALLNDYSQALSPFKNFIYKHIGRHLMNQAVKRIRKITTK